MTTTDRPAVVVDGLRASYDRRVLIDVTFTAAPRTTTVISGPPGSGKTTLARIILGSTRPDHGEVLIGARSVVGATPSELANIHGRTGFLFSGLDTPSIGRKGWAQRVGDPDDGVVAKADVAENVRRAAPGIDDIGLGACLEAFGLTNDVRRRAGDLGPGARRRLALARVFVTDPALVVLDDPVAALDPVDRDGVVEALRRARAATDATIVMTCYDLTTTKAVGDHLVALAGGRTKAQGPVDRVLRLIQSDEDYANQFVMGGKKLADTSSLSLDEHRTLLRFAGGRQSVLLVCILLVGLVCAFGVLMVLLIGHGLQ